MPVTTRMASIGPRYSVTQSAAVAARACGSNSQVRGQPRSSTPVSYTHLRAHETVLDLVCRLLLEKKKDKTKYESS